MSYVNEDKRRGVLTGEAAIMGEAVLGHELTVAELRLIPYVQSCAVDQMRIDRARVNAEEKAILKDWTERGLCRCYPWNVEVAPTREFWQFMCDVLFEAYSLELIGGDAS